MREIFDQERAMTLGAVKQATGVLAILFLIAAAFAVLSGLGQIFSGHVFHGIGRIVASLTVLFTSSYACWPKFWQRYTG